MLNSEKFYSKTNSLKDTTFDFAGHVRTLVRNTELSRMQDKKSFKDGKKKLEDLHADIDVLTCDEKTINETLDVDAGQFIKDRNEIVELNEEIKNLIPIDNVTALCPTDRVHITLMAHAIYKNVQLDADIFDTEKGGVDISKAVKAYYNKGSMKDLKDALRPVFNKIIGSEGDHFYGIKTKKSDFTDKDLRNFLATFGGSAKREQSKSKKDGVEVVKFSDFNYTDKSGNKKVQIAAFTTLCAVVLDNASKHEVIKPETTEKETETK